MQGWRCEGHCGVEAWGGAEECLPSMLSTDIGKVVFRFPDNIITPECPESGISNGNVQTRHDCCQSTVESIVGESWVNMGAVEALVAMCDMTKPGGPRTVDSAKIIIFIAKWCLALHRAGDDFENVVDGLNRDALLWTFASGEIPAAFW